MNYFDEFILWTLETPNINILLDTKFFSYNAGNWILKYKNVGRLSYYFINQLKPLVSSLISIKLKFCSFTLFLSYLST